MNIKDISENYLDSVQLSRTGNTARTYRNAINLFLLILEENGIDPNSSEIKDFNENSIVLFLTYLKNYSASTERLYLQAVKGFFEFVAANNEAEINLSRLKLLIKQRSRRSGIRLPQFPREEIEKIISHVNTNMKSTQPDSLKHNKLRALRDRAFIITLADTGLRVHEACALKRGEVDWNEAQALVIGKGNKQAVIRFSSRALIALKDYLTERSTIDGSCGLPLTSLPLFARHDKGAGKKVKPITTGTGRNIIKNMVIQSLGIEYVKKITPHSFRHYFVTTVLRASGNLKLAQELARHTNIAVTQRYSHLSDDELDKGYSEIFNSLN